jgi:hypothetical protein
MQRTMTVQDQLKAARNGIPTQGTTPIDLDMIKGIDTMRPRFSG